MGKIQDLIGQKFGRLKVLNFAGLDRWHKGRWRCQCDCGTILPAVETHQLKSGKTKSCGCYRADMRHNKRTHGQAGSRLYWVWSCMIQRCENPHNNAFANYGGRGIVVCPAWHDFLKFSLWAQESGYSDGLSLDRIDNNAGYSPDNCRWATRTQQNRNTRRNRRITFNGETLTAAEWAQRFGISYSLLSNRLKRGWSIEKALTTEKQEHRRVERV